MSAPDTVMVLAASAGKRDTSQTSPMTVAATSSKDLAGACTLMSHAMARPRKADTSFGSQAQQGGRRLKSQPTGTSQRYDLTHCHPGQAATPTRSLNWAVRDRRYRPMAAAERDWPGKEGRPSRLRGITGICIFSGQRSWQLARC